MAKKKGGKARRPQAAPVGELVKRAEEQVRLGHLDEAVKTLRRADEEIRHARGANRGVPLPPPLAETEPALNALLARTLVRRALDSTDPERQTADLEQALRREPGYVPGLLALGAVRLAGGQAGPARELFQAARQAAPDDPLVERAFRLESLAGPEREAPDWFGRMTSLAPAGGTGARRMEADLRAGLALLAAGLREEGLARLSKLGGLEHNPTRAEAAVLATQLYYAGAARFGAEQGRDAISDLSEAQRLAESHSLRLPWRDTLVPWWHRLAGWAMATNDPARAAECWRRVLEIAPAEPAAAENLEAVRQLQAAETWRSGDVQAAVEIWKADLRARPRDETLLRRVAVGLEKMDRPDEAIPHWRTLAQVWRPQLRDHPESARFRERLNRLEQHLVDMMLRTAWPEDEVRKELDAALRLDPSNHALRHRYAELYLESGQARQALKQLEMIRREGEETAELLILEGMAHDMLHQDSAARKSFERAMEVDPANQVARRAYLVLLGREAVEADQEADHERAAEICRRQLELDPHYVPALGHLAHLHLAMDDLPGALATAARIAEIDPNNPRLRVQAGDLYLQMGRRREAEAEFKRAVELEPSENCFFEIARAYLGNDQLRKALQYFDRAARVTGGPQILMTIAWLLREYEELAAAERYLRRAGDEFPLHPEPHVALAAMRADAMRLDEARHELAEAERLAAGHPGFEHLREEIQGLREQVQESEEMQELLRTMERYPASGPPPPADVLRRMQHLARKYEI